MRYLMFGEMMMRLKAPGFERLFQSPLLEATVGGSEANAAIALAGFGEEAEFLSVFPKDHPAAEEALRQLRGFGVGTDRIVFGEGRFGTYYFEQGSGFLPNKTYYDRQYSSLALAGPGSIDWDAALEGIGWLHLSGITSAVSESAARLNLEAARAAKAKGITVSVDLNYRGNLWQYGKAADEVMPELVRSADMIIATENEIKSCLGLSPEWEGNSDENFPEEKYRGLSQRCKEAFPDLRYIALSLQINYSADANVICQTLYDGKSFARSKELTVLDVVDRVGVGDAMSAGLLYGLAHYGTLQEAADFAVASGTLKSSIPGDFSRVRAEDVEALMRSGDPVEQKR